MAFNVNDFKGKLSGGGARPSLFDVQIFGQGVPEVAYHCRATQIPQSTLGQVIVPYFGRQVKLAGNRTFDDWTATIINDENFEIRNALELWSHNINQHIGNTNALGAAKAAYQGNAIVKQYGQSGDVISTYTFTGIFPTVISPIDLAWESEAVEEYSVTFSIDWWEHGDAGVNG
jgi:hypothetical protein